VTALDHLGDALAALSARGLLRARGVSRDPASLVLCSNDYLGYATEESAPRSGAGASRLVSGDHAEHVALERDLATWLRTEDALVFTSGYAANVGLVSALGQPGDVIISDERNHASIIDGCRLSRARVVVVPHCDVDATRRALVDARSAPHRYVITEGLFSMDGDTPDLAALRAACDAENAALLVDEAHAIGVLGPEGRGACAAAGVVPDAIVGTFGKALGGQGAFVAGPRVLADWLWNRARSFVFSTGLSPKVAAHVRGSVARARADEAGRARVAAISARLRGALRELGYDVPTNSHGPIVPVIVGAESAAVALSAGLLARGIHVGAIRPPTVAPGTSRLRVTVHAGLSEAAVERAIEAFREVRPQP
jgi:8-amino-7-oxononanoate synthase